MTKTTRKEDAIAYLLKNEGATSEQFHGLTIIRYNHKGSPVMAVFGRGFRPVAHYRYNDDAARETGIEKQKAYELQNVEAAARRKAEADVTAATIQKGTIFYSSWGYEQTNIDYYIVLERRGDFVMLQQIGQNRTYSGDMSGRCTPDSSTRIGEPFRKKINKHAAISLNTYSYCGVWDGRALGWSSWA